MLRALPGYLLLNAGPDSSDRRTCGWVHKDLATIGLLLTCAGLPPSPEIEINVCTSHRLNLCDREPNLSVTLGLSHVVSQVWVVNVCLVYHELCCRDAAEGVIHRMALWRLCKLDLMIKHAYGAA